MITTDQKELIKATVPVLREHGVALTTHFYSRMFTHNPELKNVFNMGNQGNGKQQLSLAMAVLAYAENIEDPSVLVSAVMKIGHKHMSLDIRPEHYTIVGKHLLASISEVLGEGATPELIEAWAVAYQQLADLMIGLEQNLYLESVAKKGGWTGWRPFLVKQKVKESEEITSFYLYPADGGKVADFMPGQYLSVRLFLPELNLLQPRQYSLSSAPNEAYYRISVKKEAGKTEHPNGLISNRLHETVLEGDVIEIAPPAGDFILDTMKDTPVVFISGGVGQTPLLSMLEYLASTESNREIVWVHGARNRQVHAFREPLTTLEGQHGKLKKHIFYDTLDELMQVEGGYYEGIVELGKLKDVALLKDADYYICGPAPFIKKQFYDLAAMGVNKEAIHYEEFGPANLVLS
ncbi:NO-inducible flavohemoprotein [Pontibacter sp. E15-1]|uniref:NO-inducible flavohemoprotein n=1 Tax=Pontibacter sp. E15-1 TaxID=2919918 RepID=UPI001F4FB306|nr:NO-inducible flavohemoprotein [Pontibacter sp. E15-1]MCJ8165677.1 NO-inducible flavohemoprotein [Pontibacter sp. E15-1]